MPPPRNVTGHYSTELAKSIHDAWADNRAVVDNFGGPGIFNQTVEKIDRLDEVFQSTRGAYFHLGSTPAETSQNFADTQLRYRQTGVRPSLPSQMAHYLDQVAFPRESPYYKAAVLVAARAEVEHASHPEYHNPYHFSDVVATTIEFLKKNNALAVQGVPGAVKLSREELAIGMIAAAGHDVGHPGGKNALPGQTVPPDPFRLERQSVSILDPLLRETGIPPESRERITALILATSPDSDGPCGLLREIDRLHLAGEPIKWQTLPEHEKFPELRSLAEDPSIRVIAQNLRSADLAESTLFGLGSHMMATIALQMEWQSRGYGDRMVGDATAEDGSIIQNGQTVKARKWFLEFVAYGEAGPPAVGAKAAVGQNYADLYAGSKADFDSVRAQEQVSNGSSTRLDPGDTERNCSS